MRTLARRYHPITGTPFQQDETYREVAPCAALAPYIRCFWGSDHPLPARPGDAGLVIPDTCMDIIFHIDYANNRIGSVFCTLDEHSYRTPASTETGGLASTFAIRFYAWTASLFAEDKLNGSANGHFPVDTFFRSVERMLTPVLFEETTLMGKVLAAEKALLTTLRPEKADQAVLCAIHHLLRTEGRARISEVSAALALSPRQLERRFDAAMGVSPKAFASLMRYQLLWQDMALSPRFDPLDAVDRFGYADQAHLLHDFRKRHLMSPREALDFARK
jgi:transcriptional regulator GlxA family with amidase domain